MIDNKKDIADILEPIMKILTDIRSKNEIMIENIEEQHHHIKTLLKDLQEKINKLTKDMIERAAENLNEIRATVNMIVNQMKLTMKVLTQYMNDVTFIQI